MENPAYRRRGALELPEQALEDLGRVTDLLERESEIVLIGDRLRGIMTLKEATSSVASALGVALPDATRFVRVIVSLHSLRRSLRLSPLDLIQWVNESLQRESPPKWFDAWEKCTPIVARLLEPDHPLGTLEKGLYLAYEYQNVATKLQLLTDIRPVFSDDASRIDRHVLSYLLRLEYHDGAHLHTFDLALDAEDIRELRQLCERAEVKAKTVREQLGAKIPVSIAGDLDKWE